MENQSVSHSFWLYVRQWTLTHGGFFFSSFLSFDFCDCTNMDCFRCVYIFHFNHPFPYRVGWFYERIYFNVVKFDGECCRQNWSHAFVSIKKNSPENCVWFSLSLSLFLPYYSKVVFEYRACAMRKIKNNRFASPLTFHIHRVYICECILPALHTSFYELKVKCVFGIKSQTSSIVQWLNFFGTANFKRNLSHKVSSMLCQWIKHFVIGLFLFFFCFLNLQFTILWMVTAWFILCIATTYSHSFEILLKSFFFLFFLKQIDNVYDQKIF